MKRLARAAFGGDVGGALRFELDDGWQCRIHAYAEDMFRVLLLRNGELREPRTWAIAPNGTDVPWEGRDRFDTNGFVRPELTMERRDDAVTLAAAGLSVAVTLQPFGLRWRAGGRSFARDRATYSYEWDGRSGGLRHSMERAPARHERRLTRSGRLVWFGVSMQSRLSALLAASLARCTATLRTSKSPLQAVAHLSRGLFDVGVD